RMKRRLLRDLVQQNVDLIQGRPPRRLRFGYRVGVALRVLTLGLISVALFGSTQLLSGLAGARPAGAVRTRLAALAPGPVAPPAGAGGVAFSQDPIDATVFPLAVRRVAIDPGHGGAS